MSNFHVMVKQIAKIDGTRADEFLEWIPSFVLALACTTRQMSTSYKSRSDRQKSMPARRPLARPGMPQIKTYTACSFSPQLVQCSPWFGGFSAKHRLREQDTDNKQTTGMDSSSREIRQICLRAAIRVEHIRITSTRMCPGSVPDDYLYHMDSFRDYLNACDPPKGLTDQQYKDIILEVLPSQYDRLRHTHLERRDFGLGDICRMMAATYADNLSRSESSKGLAGSGAAMQVVDRDRTSVLCHYCDQFGHFKRKCPLQIKHQQQHRQSSVWYHLQQQQDQH